MNEIVKNALKNLVKGLDDLNEAYNEDFGEDSPYKLDEESENILREVVKEDKEK